MTYDSKSLAETAGTILARMGIEYTPETADQRRARESAEARRIREEE